MGKQARMLAGSAVLLIVVALNPGLDFTLQRVFFDPVTATWPLRHSAWFESVFHTGLKATSLVIAVAAWILCVFAWRRKIPWLAPRSALVLALGLALVPIVIGALKQLTNKHCPWDLIEFGGQFPYVGLFDTTAAGAARGRCWPAGHAAGGFAWLALGPALRGHSPAVARRAILIALCAGFVMGMSRVVQGAHFVSHVLWSAWIAWATIVLVTALVQPRLAPTHARGFAQ